MRLIKDGNVYVCDCEFSEKDEPKLAGFRWNPQKKQWWTGDILKAAKFSAHADMETAVELSAVLKDRGASEEASRADNSDLEIPSPEGLSYYPFQRAGIAYAQDRRSVLIGDEMGLGKSIEAIGLMNLDENPGRTLVLCPASLKINWHREIAKWLTHSRTVGVAHSKQPLPETDIVIMNYDILAKFDLFEETVRRKKKAWAYVGPEWDYLIVDECHYLKNGKARRSKLVKEIKARKRVLLTGTPITNRPVELLMPLKIMGVLDQIVSRDWDYLTRYCDARKNSFGWDFTGASNMAELQEKLRSTVMVRRLKKDVLAELPDKVRQVIEIAANGNQAIIDAENASWKRHEEMLVSLKASTELAKASDNREKYEEAVRNLREGAGHAFGEMAKARHDIAVAKIPAAIVFLRDAIDSSGKVVVFAHHHDVIEAFAKEFADEAAVLYGPMKQEERQRNVDRFQSDPICRLFVGSILAAGVGLTLTASSHVVFSELDWVPGNVSQAEDRLHRIGQKDSVLVQHLVFDGSIDARMAKTIVGKQRTIDAVLDSDIGDEPAIPARTDPIVVKKRELEKTSVLITKEQRETIHGALKTLDALCDGARDLDGMGFNRVDTRIGKSLANQAYLTPKQAAIGKSLVAKYRRQLPADLVAAIIIKRNTDDK